jgi:hypothetical protein
VPAGQYLRDFEKKNPNTRESLELLQVAYRVHVDHSFLFGVSVDAGEV